MGFKKTKNFSQNGSGKGFRRTSNFHYDTAAIYRKFTDFSDFSDRIEDFSDRYGRWGSDVESYLSRGESSLPKDETPLLSTTRYNGVYDAVNSAVGDPKLSALAIEKAALPENDTNWANAEKAEALKADEAAYIKEANDFLKELEKNKAYLSKEDYDSLYGYFSGIANGEGYAGYIDNEYNFRTQFGSRLEYDKAVVENDRQTALKDRTGANRYSTYGEITTALASPDLAETDRKTLQELLGTQGVVLTMTEDEVKSLLDQRAYNEKFYNEHLKYVLRGAAPDFLSEEEAAAQSALGYIDDPELNAEWVRVNREMRSYAENPYAFYDDYGNPVTWEEFLEIVQTEGLINDIFKASGTAESNRINEMAGTSLTSADRDALEEIYQKNPEVVNSIVEGGVKEAKKKTDTYYNYLDEKEKAYNRGEELSAWAEKNPIPAALASLAVSPIQIGDFVGNIFSDNRSELSRRANVYNDVHITASQAFTQGVIDRIDRDISNDAIADLVGTVYSGASSSFNSAITGGVATLAFGPTAGPVVAGAILGSQAAATTYNTAIKNGSTVGQAFTYSIVAGAAESIFESLSIEKLYSMGLKFGEKGIKNALHNALAVGWQGVTEASEELATSIVDSIADTLINGKFSEFNLSVDRYIQQGLSESEAYAKANKDFLDSLKDDALGGFFGGVFGGAGAAVIGKTAYDYNVRKGQIKVGNAIINKGNTAPLFASARELNDPKLNKSLAKAEKTYQKDAARQQKSKGDAKVGKKAALYVGRLYDSLSDAQQRKAVNSKRELFKSEVKKALEGKENADKAEKVILKAMYTGNLSSSDVAVLDEVGGKEIVNSILNSNEFKAANEKISAEENEAYFNDLRLVTVTNEAKAKIDAIQNNDLKVSKSGATKVNGEKTSIKKIKSISPKGSVVVIEDGTEVNVRDLELSEDEATIISGLEYIAEEVGLSTEDANYVLQARSTNPSIAAADYVLGVEEALTYGKYSLQKSALAKTSFAGKLNEDVRNFLYDRAEAASAAEAEAKVAEQKKAAGKVAKKNGGVFAEDGIETNPNGEIDTKGFSKVQKKSLEGIKALAAVSPLEFHIFRSKKVNGEYVATIRGEVYEGSPNGLYFAGTNEIWLDINAGDFGEGTMLWTAGHEISHYIKEKNLAAWRKMAQFIMEQYAENDVDAASMLERQKAKIKSRSDAKNMTEAEILDLAYEELIADAMTNMLTDGSVVQFLADVKAKDEGLWKIIKDALFKILKNWGEILGVYEGRELETEEARALEAIKGAREKLQRMFADAFAEANEVSDIIAVDVETESVAPVRSERTWTESEYVQKREETALAIKEALGVSIAKARKYIDDINSIAKLIAEDRVRLDYVASRFGSAFVSNSEYGGSFDYTTLCKKRRLFTGTFTEIQKRLRNTALTPDDILKIRNMMIEKGLEATCGLCYVEGSRANMGKFAKEFIRLYERDNPGAWIPDMADVNTPDGVESMRINHPEAYEQYEYFWNHYGKLKESDPALFASQQKPKLYEARKAYDGEILKLFKNSDTINEKNRNGGIRMQSFSDFEIVHLIDTMQVIMDMSRVGLAGQAYTKVPEFAEAFGNTGLKINLSLIAKGVDENGNLVFDDREGMPHETAFDIRNRYSKNVGTVIVTFTDEQLYAAMADPRIDFIIPFHRSQWKKGQYGAMGLPKGTKDYTYIQNEKLIKQTYHEYRGRMVKDKAKNYMPNTYWDDSKSGKENAELYLDMCAKDHKRPKFYKFLDYVGDGRYALKKDGSTDGYWKLLIDFKMYDNKGNYSPQMPVRPEFSMDAATQMLTDYKGGHNVYPVASAVVDEFVEEYKANNPKAMHSERNRTQLDRDYMAAVERGDMETAQMMVDEAAKKAGYTPVTRYHQTGKRFNVFSNENPDAGLNDSDTPNGYFFKENDHDIGVGADFVKTGHGGSIQMSVFLKTSNMLYFKNRDAATKWYAEHVPGYGDVLAKYNKHLSDFERISKENNNKMFDELMALDASGKSTPTLDLEIMEKYDKILDDWIADTEKYSTGLRAEMRRLLNEYFIENDSGYDGIELADDGHRYIDMKREDVHTYIVFKNTQIKSADPVTYDDNGNVIPLSERFKKSNPDIRYSQRNTESRRAILANALETTATTKAEQKLLNEYRENISKYEQKQAELDKVNEQLHKLYTVKGKRDMEAIRSLRAKADKLANSISHYDQNLLKLESTKDLKNVVETERSRARAEQRAHTEQIYKDRAEGRRRTIFKRKTLSVIKELDTLLNKGNKKKNVKIGLQETVREALATAEMLFTESITNEQILEAGFHTELHSAEDVKWIKAYENALDRIEAAQKKLSDIGGKEGSEALQREISSQQKRIEGLKGKLKNAFALERRFYSRDTVEKALNGLAHIYEKTRESEDVYIKNAYDPDLYNRIRALASEDFTGTSINDMTSEQLEEVYRTYKMVLNSVKKAGKLFRNGKAESLAEYETAINEDLVANGKEGKDKLDFFKKIGDASGEYAWNLLEPWVAAERLGSEHFRKLIWDLIGGEQVYGKDVLDAKRYKDEMKEKYHYKKWGKKVDTAEVITLSDGRKEKLTLGDMMSIYAYSRRPQAKKHMEIGGFVPKGSYKTGLLGKLGRKIVRAGNHKIKITEADVAIIKKKLSEVEGCIDYVESMQSYLSDVVGAKGNEAARILYGVDIFNEQIYFPLKSEKDFLSIVNEDKKPGEKGGFFSLKSTGVAKETAPKANNPIILEGFDAVWDEHIETMANYHAFVVPLDNIQKVFGSVRPEISEGGDGAVKDITSVRANIRKYFGNAAVKYFSNLLKDANGGSTSATGYKNPLAKLVGTAKKVSVQANLSVIAQQYFSIIRAMAEVNPKYFVQHKDLGTQKNIDARWKTYREMLEHAPFVVIKEMGGHDVGATGSAADYINGPDTVIGKIDTVMGFGSNLMDKLGWVTIWSAVKKEIADTKSFEVGSEEFFAAVSKRFHEVVVKTQVYASNLTRNGMMRSKSDYVKAMTAFTGEPIKQINMHFAAMFAKGSRSAKKATRVIIVNMIAGILTTLAAAIAVTGRDDDEDESVIEKFMQALGNRFAQDVNPLNYLPVTRDILSVWEGWDISRPDMDLISEIVGDVRKTYDYLTDKEREPDAEADKAFFISTAETAFLHLSNFIGIPLSNVKKEIKSIGTVFFDHFDDILPQRVAISLHEGFFGVDYGKSDRLFIAYELGDQARYDAVAKQYKDEDSAKTALRGEIYDRYKDGSLDYDTAFEYLVDIGENKKDKEYYEKRAEKEGVTVKELMQEELEANAYFALEEQDYNKEHKGDKAAPGYKKYNDFYSAVETGKDFEKVVKSYTDNFVTLESLLGEITSHFKPIYISMSKSERAKLKPYLLNAYCYLFELQLEEKGEKATKGKLNKQRHKKSEDIDAWLEE